MLRVSASAGSQGVWPNLVNRKIVSRTGRAEQTRRTVELARARPFAICFRVGRVL